MPESGCKVGYYEPWHIELQGVGGCQGSLEGGGGGLGGFLGDLLRTALGFATSTKNEKKEEPRATTTRTATSSVDINKIFGTLGSTTQYGTSTASSAASRLEELVLEKPPTSPTSTATSVPVVVTGEDAAYLEHSDEHGGAAPSTVGSQHTQQTFISGDLSWQNNSSQPVSAWNAIFLSIRAAINRILSYLVPFGGASQPVIEEQTDLL